MSESHYTWTATRGSPQPERSHLVTVSDAYDEQPYVRIGDGAHPDCWLFVAERGGLTRHFHVRVELALGDGDDESVYLPLISTSLSVVISSCSWG